VTETVVFNKLTEAIKDLEIQLGIKAIALRSATLSNRVLRDEIEKLVVEVAELQERLQEG
jgi:hypothetical protein